MCLFINPIVPRHVKTVDQLSVVNISSKKDKVEFSVENMDIFVFRNSAIYEEINAWCHSRSALIDYEADVLFTDFCA